MFGPRPEMRLLGGQGILFGLGPGLLGGEGRKRDRTKAAGYGPKGFASMDELFHDVAMACQFSSRNSALAIKPWQNMASDCSSSVMAGIAGVRCLPLMPGRPPLAPSIRPGRGPCPGRWN